MIIKLSPIRSDAQISVFRLGDMLTISGLAFDFSSLPEGATLPAGSVQSPWLLGPVERVAGRITASLRLPHAADAGDDARFPVDIVDPAEGPVQLPGLPILPAEPSTVGMIDWSQLITAEDKAAAAAATLLAQAQAEITRRRAQADQAIAPLQDAVDLDEASQAEADLLKAWKRYRVALNRVPEQPGYPASIDWPAPPA